MDIRFYDNDEVNWYHDMNAHDEIEFYNVKNEVNQFISNVSIPNMLSDNDKDQLLNTEYIRYFAKLGNTYAVFLQTILDNQTAKVRLEDIVAKPHPTNGMDLHLHHLIAWASTSTTDPKLNKAVILDWDRTITAVERIFIPALDADVVNADDVFEFIMGGKDRVKTYQDLFQTLHTHNVSVFVITHNIYASLKQNSRAFYVQMIQKLMQSKTFGIDANAGDILICSSDHQHKKYLSACSTSLKLYLAKCAQSEHNSYNSSPQTAKLKKKRKTRKNNNDYVKRRNTYKKTA